MFETILDRRGKAQRGGGSPRDAAGTHGAAGGASGEAAAPPEPGAEEGQPARLEVHDPARARRLFGDLVPLPPDAGEPTHDLSPLLTILSFPPPDPEHPLFERLAGPGAAPAESARRAAAAAPAVRLAPVPGVAPPAFASLLRHDRARRAGRRAAWTGLGAGVQVALIASAVVLASAAAAPAIEEVEMIVPVHLPAAAPRKAAGPPGLPGLPAAPAPRRRATPGARPRAALPPPPPSALLQPREVQAAMRLPDPGEPIEALPESDAGEYAEGDEEGVVGGVVGGGGGGAWGAGASVAGVAAGAGMSGEIEDAPQYMTAGFRKPVEQEPGCVRRAVRLPRELTGFTSGPLTVRVAVGGDGAIGRIELLSTVPDVRIARAIEQAVRGCAWRGGADATGRPVAIWVVMPIRFEGV